jgi:hypothetical protein
MCGSKYKSDCAKTNRLYQRIKRICQKREEKRRESPSTYNLTVQALVQNYSVSYPTNK